MNKLYNITVLKNSFIKQPAQDNFLKLTFITNGSCDLVIENNMYKLNVGDLICSNNSFTYTNESKDLKYFELYFEKNIIDINISLKDFFNKEISNHLGYGNEIIKNTGAFKLEIERLFNQIHKEYINKEMLYEVKLQSYLLNILTTFARSFNLNESSEKYSDYINNAIDFIHKNYYKNIYIEDIAKIAMMSTSYFTILFKEATGKTFIQYLNELRILKAKEMLVNVNKKIINISSDVGYNNITYFNKVFKKATGYSPSSYKKLKQAQC